jgi:phage portal protein BeeE
MCTALEQAIIKRVATSDERKKYAVKFRLSEVNRASDTERYQIYSQAVQNGILTRNEVRRMEGLEDMEGADSLTAQTNLLPVEDLGKQDASQEPQTTLTTEPQKQ